MNKVQAWVSSFWESSWGLTSFWLILPQPFRCLETWNLIQMEDYISVSFVLFSQRFKHSGSWMIRRKLKAFLPISPQDKEIWFIEICPEPNSAVLTCWWSRDHFQFQKRIHKSLYHSKKLETVMQSLCRISLYQRSILAHTPCSFNLHTWIW